MRYPYYILISFLVILFSVPEVLFAAEFDRDLYFGMKGDEVMHLQEFLQDEKVYSGPVNGNFYSLTREGVRQFQGREGISPAAGYFGPRTRSRAHAVLASRGKAPAAVQAELIALFTKQIQELQQKLKVAQIKLADEQAAPAPAPAPEPPLPPPPPPPPPAPSNTVIFSGKSTSEFPQVATTPLAIGKFTIKNDTAATILLANMEVLILDEMDSTFNRGTRVFFLLRDGSFATDAKISRTEFTFSSTPPKIGDPHRTLLELPYDITIKAGEERTASLWVEQLDYVRAGSLEIKTNKVAATDPISVNGSFDFILTKTPKP